MDNLQLQNHDLLSACLHLWLIYLVKGTCLVPKLCLTRVHACMVSICSTNIGAWLGLISSAAFIQCTYFVGWMMVHMCHRCWLESFVWFVHMMARTTFATFDPCTQCVCRRAAQDFYNQTVTGDTSLLVRMDSHAVSTILLR